MTDLQIILLSVIGFCVALSIIFMIMFIVEISAEPKEEKKEVVQNVFVNQNVEVQEAEPEIKEASVSDMLLSLDEQTKDEVVEEPAKEEVVEEATKEEVVEEATKEEVVEEATKEEVVEEKPEEVAQVVEEPVAAQNEVDEAEDLADDDDDSETIDDVLDFKEEPHEVVIPAGSVFDYRARLEKIIASRDKIERDLAKVQKSILKYERTKRRMNRNQKMLDRRASELTNLNLVMYSVTDIKNVDEEKKLKQEDLTAHIAELKASIQDADEYIESNKEKNEHNAKLARYLLQERARYNEEIAELEELIKKSEDSTENA
jgi:hypothetical protein